MEHALCSGQWYAICGTDWKLGNRSFVKSVKILDTASQNITFILLENLISKLKPIIPNNRMTFWENLPIADNNTSLDFDDEIERVRYLCA